MSKLLFNRDQKKIMYKYNVGDNVKCVKEVQIQNLNVGPKLGTHGIIIRRHTTKNKKILYNVDWNETHEYLFDMNSKVWPMDEISIRLKQEIGMRNV